MRGHRENENLEVPREIYYAIQSALNYRSVTVESDEPLCIATLRLHIKYILQVADAQERMRRSSARLSAGGTSVPASVIFYGWRTLDMPA
jgi:hypothetical protein